MYRREKKIIIVICISKRNEKDFVSFVFISVQVKNKFFQSIYR